MIWHQRVSDYVGMWAQVRADLPQEVDEALALEEDWLTVVSAIV
jgi:hypothetical protein